MAQLGMHKVGKVSLPVGDLVGLYEGRLARILPTKGWIWKDESSLLRRMEKGGVWWVWDERGEEISSEGLARLWEDLDRCGGVVDVAVGGAFGHSDQVRARAQKLLRLGNMIWPSDLAWVMVWEQFYRAASIRKGTKYHHGGMLS